jgi:hypothetical protein
VIASFLNRRWDAELLADFADKYGIDFGMTRRRAPAPIRRIEDARMLRAFLEGTTLPLEMLDELAELQLFTPVGTWMRTGMIS